jgi:hypothetical protein
MQKTQINKFIPIYEVECSDLLVPWLAEWPNWRHEQPEAILLAKECRRIFRSDILNIKLTLNFGSLLHQEFYYNL